MTGLQVPRTACESHIRSPRDGQDRWGALTAPAPIPSYTVPTPHSARPFQPHIPSRPDLNPNSIFNMADRPERGGDRGGFGRGRGRGGPRRGPRRGAKRDEEKEWYAVQTC